MVALKQKEAEQEQKWVKKERRKEAKKASKKVTTKLLEETNNEETLLDEQSKQLQYIQNQAKEATEALQAKDFTIEDDNNDAVGRCDDIANALAEAMAQL